MERLVAGRERIYLDHFWNDFSADPADMSKEMREHYAALYTRPGAMRAGFAQFNAFSQDAIDNKAFVEQGKFTFAVLAVGGEASTGSMTEGLLKLVADDVTRAVVPAAGHWLMEENPQATGKVVQDFSRNVDSDSCSSL